MDWEPFLGHSGMPNRQYISCSALITTKSSLPEDAKMLCLELYADKTQLSSFGTEKGYPVMARIANLPVNIRNGKGYVGSRVVGWLPVVRFTPPAFKTTDRH